MMANVIFAAVSLFFFERLKVQRFKSVFFKQIFEFAFFKIMIKDSVLPLKTPRLLFPLKKSGLSHTPHVRFSERLKKNAPAFFQNAIKLSRRFFPIRLKQMLQNAQTQNAVKRLV